MSKITQMPPYSVVDSADPLEIVDVSDTSLAPSGTNKRWTPGGIQTWLAGFFAPLTRTLTAGDGLSGGGDLSANRSFAVDNTVQRRITGGTTGNLVSRDLTGDIQDDGVSSATIVYPPTATALTGTWTPTLSPGNTVRYYTNAALTVNAPSGDGHLAVILGASADLTLNGAYTVLGAREAGKMQACYLSNDTTNTVTIFCYGSAEP